MRDYSSFAAMILVLAFFQVIPGSQSHSKDSDLGDQEALQVLVERFVTAWNQEDPEGIAVLFAADAEFIGPTGKVVRTRPEIKNLVAKERQETYKGTILSKRIDEIHLAKANVAVVKGSYALSGLRLIPGVTISPEGSFIFWLQKKDGEWNIARAEISKS